MSDRTPTTCDQCGQTDTHPKWNDFNGVTKHHDCLSYNEEQFLRDSSTEAGEVIDAAKSGVHGDDLLAFIENLHEES